MLDFLRLMLIALIETLSGESVTQRYHKNPHLDIQKIENCSIAIDFIKKFMRVNVSAKGIFLLSWKPYLTILRLDLATGNQKVLMGLIWRLILHFQVLDLDKENATAKISNTAKQVATSRPCPTEMFVAQCKEKAS